MSGPALHVGATGKCPHGGTVTVVGASRVTIFGMPIGTMAAAYPIAPCLFQVPVPGGTKPQPCVRVQWGTPAARVKVMGAPVVTQLSTGACLSVEQIPQGPPAMKNVQKKVIAL